VAFTYAQLQIGSCNLHLHIARGASCLLMNNKQTMKKHHQKHALFVPHLCLHDSSAAITLVLST